MEEEFDRVLTRWTIKVEDLDIGSDVLGEGAFGEVRSGFLRNGMNKVEVAIKKIPISDNPPAREWKRLLQEAVVLARASEGCRNICRLLGICLMPRFFCLVMKRYATSLDKKLDGYPDRKAPPAKVQRWMVDICQAVVELHEQGIIIQDLKPSNVLLDKFESASLADFGISKITTNTSVKLKATTSAMGTSPYMAPELFEGKSISNKCDVWALGCLLLELETGKAPWQTLTSFQIMHQVCVKKSIPPIPSNLDRQFVDMLESCFCYEPSARASPMVILQEVSDRKFRVMDEQPINYQSTSSFNPGPTKIGASLINSASTPMNVVMKSDREKSMTSVSDWNFWSSEEELSLFKDEPDRNIGTSYEHQEPFNFTAMSELHHGPPDTAVHPNNREIRVWNSYSNANNGDNAFLTEPLARGQTSNLSGHSSAYFRRFKDLSLKKLKKRTSDFEDSFEAGQGQIYGRMFFIKIGTFHAAIKKLHAIPLSDADFVTKATRLTKLNNENVLELSSWYLEGKLRVALYECASQGDLYQTLHLPGHHVDFSRRAAIAVAAARGLEYLHETLDPPIIHGSVKSWNIFLYDGCVAKIGDYNFMLYHQSDSLCRWGDHRCPPSPTGLTAHDAPEFDKFKFTYDPENSKFSTATDVYSFGVVLLELLSGRKPYDDERSNRQMVISWVKPLLSKFVTDEFIAQGYTLSKKLRTFIDPHMGDYLPEQCVWMVYAAALCLQDDPEERPDMSEVVSILERCL